MSDRFQNDLKAYMSAVGQHKLLTREEEVELATRWRDAGDPEAARQLVVCNLRAVVKIAGEFRNHNLAFADLVQEGNMGLLRAVDRYNPERGVRFLSYAGWWIRACIKEYVLRHRSLVRMGTTQKQRVIFSRLGRSKAQLSREEQQRGEPFTRAERLARLSEIMGVSASVVEEMQGRLAGYDLSLDQPMDSEGGSSFIDFLADSAPTADVATEEREARAVTCDHLQRALSALTPKEREVIEARFLGEERRTLKDIGIDFGVSRERVRQIEMKARQKLRRLLKKQGFERDLGLAHAAGWAA